MDTGVFITKASTSYSMQTRKVYAYKYIVFNFFDNSYFTFPGGKVLNKITRKECLALIMIEASVVSEW